MIPLTTEEQLRRIVQQSVLDELRRCKDSEEAMSDFEIAHHVARDVVHRLEAEGIRVLLPGEAVELQRRRKASR